MRHEAMPNRDIEKYNFCSSALYAALLFVALYVLTVSSAAIAKAPSHRPFPAQFQDADVFLRAIASASRDPIPAQPLSGITVPHHLVAADLIARGFQAVEASGVEKVVVLFPDHFKRSHLPFSTTRHAFDTVFGRVDVNKRDVVRLLQAPDLVGDSELFGTDHGIGAVLPFIKHFLPAARIVPIAVAYGSQPSDWDALATRLEPLIGPGTLIVQSTDFSHYLPPQEAAQRDQEVLNVLASGNLDAVTRLRSPQHTDSRGAQYLQMRLQHDVFHARPDVLFNANAQSYTSETLTRTTSYIVQAYKEAHPDPQVGRDRPGSKVYCFAGDTFFGRRMLRLLTDPGAAERIQREAQHFLNGCRLIVNLTGVLVPELPVNLESLILAMPSALTLRWLKALNVVAVDLANNHTMDLGAEPFAEMSKTLKAAGITVLEHGAITDLGTFRLTALTDLDNRTERTQGVIEPSVLMQLAQSVARPPLFAMVNWGTDYDPKPGPRQLALMNSLHESAVSLIIGVHPHVAAPGLDLINGGEGLSAFSLGNFIFDQTSKVASGSVLEVRIFEQGTYFARLVEHDNFFEDGLHREGGD
jgi:AmmeMemoRadiSam system protein B